MRNNRDSKPHFQSTQASHAGTHSHYTSLLILTIWCSAPNIKSLHLVSPGYIHVYTPVVHPFPALKFHLQTTILIHRMRGSALGGLSLVWGIRAETNDSIAPTKGISLRNCCLASTRTINPIWRFSHPSSITTIYTTHVKILYLYIFYTHGTMR